MGGFYGEGRLQDEEWLMRAGMIINRERPSHVPEISADTAINTAFTQQSAEFEALMSKLDPEGDIDLERFPMLAFFDLSERWPLDIILGAILALLIFLLMPNWYGFGEYTAYLLVVTYVVVQVARAMRRRQRQEVRMRKMGLTPGQRYELSLRKLVKFRKAPAPQGAPENVTIH